MSRSETEIVFRVEGMLAERRYGGVTKVSRRAIRKSSLSLFPWPTSVVSVWSLTHFFCQVISMHWQIYLGNSIPEGFSESRDSGIGGSQSRDPGIQKYPPGLNSLIDSPADFERFWTKNRKTGNRLFFLSEPVSEPLITNFSFFSYPYRFPGRFP